MMPVASLHAVNASRDRLLRPPLALALALLFACALPFTISNYQVFQATLVIIQAIALLGLNLLTGYNGQVSLGHGAFSAIGAYTAAILMDRLGVPYWLTVPAAGTVCFGAGFLFGLPALRLEGTHLALATFALGVSMPQILKYKRVERWTGGVQGITLQKPDAPWGLPLAPDQWLYFFCLAVMLLLFACAWNFLRSHAGRAIVAIREQPIAASSVGIDVPMYKTLTFGVSAMYTGIAGALGAVAVQFVSPDSFSVFLSISLLVGIVVGGLSSISGAIYGAIFIQFVPKLAGDISKAAPGAIYGMVLIASVYLLPTGIAGGIKTLAQHLLVRVLRSSRQHRRNHA